MNSNRRTGRRYDREFRNAAAAQTEVLDVSPSGFAAHRRKPGRPRRRQDEELRPLIAQSFEQGRRTYGCLRLRRERQDLGRGCGKNRIARIIREAGLRPRQKRRFRPRPTDSRPVQPVAENWLAKVPTPDRPGLVWQSGFTHLETAEGRLFLAFTLNACTRRWVAHHCRLDLRGDVTTTTVVLARQRQPPPPGLLHHSDRGVQYAAAHGLTLSVSRPATQSVTHQLRTFVTDHVSTSRRPPSPAAARFMASDDIESFCNRRRRHPPRTVNAVLIGAARRKEDVGAQLAGEGRAFHAGGFAHHDGYPIPERGAGESRSHDG